jgi:hypothetical protein
MTSFCVVPPWRFFRFVLLSVILSCAFLPSPATAGLCREWVINTNYGGPDVITAMAVDSAGNTIVTGYTNLTGTDDAITIKYNPSGGIIWSKSYIAGLGNTRPVALKLDFWGNIFITGTRYDLSNSPLAIFTIFYTTSGDMATGWPKIFSFENGHDFEAAAIDIHSGTFFFTDSIFVSGSYISNFDGNTYYATIKYNTDGTFVRTSAYRSAVGKPIALKVDSAGNAYVIAPEGNSGNLKFLIAKYDINGNNAPGWPQIWSLAGSPSPEAVPAALAVDGQGNVYVTGYTKFDQTSASRFATLKYNSNGVMAAGWPRVAGGLGTDAPAALVLDGQGNVIVTGTAANAAGNYDIYTLKYSPDGAVIWSRRYASNTINKAKAMTWDYQDNIYVTGTTKSSLFLFSWATMVKYSSSGRQIWQTTIADNVEPVGLKLDSHRLPHVYVAGTYRPLFPTGTANVYLSKYNQVNRVPWELLLTD